MIYLNLGSNLPLEEGGRETNILKAINHLKNLNLKLIKISSFYETPSYLPYLQH
jgi:7,8-dihydro-6-hydroxymethylpterin-pyrophosphokinase